MRGSQFRACRACRVVHSWRSVHVVKGGGVMNASSSTSPLGRCGTSGLAGSRWLRRAVIPDRARQPPWRVQRLVRRGHSILQAHRQRQGGSMAHHRRPERHTGTVSVAGGVASVPQPCARLLKTWRQGVGGGCRGTSSACRSRYASKRYGAGASKCGRTYDEDSLRAAQSALRSAPPRLPGRELNIAIGSAVASPIPGDDAALERRR
jgi:hypothetical protein